MNGAQISRLASSPRAQKRFLIASLTVLALGVVAAVLTLTWHPRHESGTSAAPAPTSEVGQQGKTVPVSAEEKAVATKWIFGAVDRSDLAATFDLTHPDLRGSMTRKEWATGTIPVTPYPVGKLTATSWKTDSSHSREAVLEVKLTPAANAPVAVRPLTFIIGLTKSQGADGDKWRVNYWAPKYKPPVRLGE